MLGSVDGEDRKKRKRKKKEKAIRIDMKNRPYSSINAITSEREFVFWLSGFIYNKSILQEIEMGILRDNVDRLMRDKL